MAADKITDIIDDKAFEQLEALIQKLVATQAEFGKLSGNVLDLNSNLGKVKGFKELEEKVAKLQEATNKMQEIAIKAEDIANKTREAEAKLIQVTKQKLEVEAKAEAAAKALIEAEKNKEKAVRKSTQAQKEASESMMVDSKTTEAARAMLDKYSGTAEDLIQMQINLKMVLSNTRAEQKEATAAFKEGRMDLDDYADTIHYLGVVEAETKKSIMDFNLEIRRTLKETNSATGSYDEMTSTLDRLRGLYRRLTEEERNNAEIGGVLTKSIEEYDAVLRELDTTMKISTRNVGNYSDAIEDALDKSGLFSKQLAILKDIKAAYAAGAKVATIATQSFSKALIASGIGIIIIILAGIIGYLTRFQKGMDLVAKATDYVSTFLAVFMDALSVLGEQIVNNFLPILGGLKDTVVGFLTLDFKQMKQGFADVKTGINNIDPIRLVEVGKAAAEAAAQAAKLRGEIIALDEAESILGVTNAKKKATLEALSEISSDESAAIKDRLAANKQILEIENSLESENLRIKEERLRITKEQNLLTKSGANDDAKQKERDLEIEIEGIKAEASKRRRKAVKEENSLLSKAASESKAIRDQRLADETKAANALLDLEASRLKRSIERTKKVVDDDKQSFDDRLSNLQQYVLRQEELINVESKKQLNQKDLLDSQILQIEEETNAKLAALKQEGSDLILKIIADQGAQEDAARIKAQAKTLALIEQQRDEQLEALNNQFNNGEIPEELYAAERLRLQKQFTKAYIEEEMKAVEAIIEINKARGLDTFEQEKQLAALRLKLSQAVADGQIEDLAKVADAEERLAELKEELSQELANLAMNLVGRQFELEQQAIDKKNEELDKNKDKEIEAINESVLSNEDKATRIKIIEARTQAQKEALEKRSRLLQQKQAQFEKAAGIASIIANTAVAIMKQLALTPLPLGFPLVATIGAIGAVQLASAIAIPIPAFAVGTENSPEGFALVGERGTETRIDPDGKVSLTPDKPTLTYLKKGTVIKTAEDTKKMFSNSMADVMSYDKSGNFDLDKLDASYRRGVKELKKTFLSKKDNSTVITKSGVHYMYKTGNSWKEYLNRNI
jgi:hypothetical protein